MNEALRVSCRKGYHVQVVRYFPSSNLLLAECRRVKIATNYFSFNTDGTTLSRKTLESNCFCDISIAVAKDIDKKVGKKPFATVLFAIANNLLETALSYCLK
ncbi:hypothetical protein ACSBR2_012126 [Camellia fascicularis]